MLENDDFFEQLMEARSSIVKLAQLGCSVFEILTLLPDQVVFLLKRMLDQLGEINYIIFWTNVFRDAQRDGLFLNDSQEKIPFSAISDFIQKKLTESLPNQVPS